MNNAPELLKNRYITWSAKNLQEKRPAGTLTDWLTALSSDEAEQKVSNECFLYYLQWNTHRVEKQLDPEHPDSSALIELIDQEKQEYTAGVLKGVKEGWLHPNATENVKHVATTEVYIGDIFSTIVKGNGGYSPRMTNYVVIRGGDTADDTMYYTRHALKHELNHKVIGESPETWLDEALT